jgi:dihydroorotate dehydrogenase (NAD+) catalytic subunit
VDERQFDIRWSELITDLAGLTSQKNLAEQVGVNVKEIGRWMRGEVKPQGSNAATLLKICDDLGVVNWRKYSKTVPVYDFRSEYEENVSNGPQGIPAKIEFSVPRIPTRIWRHELNSPLGIPASVLTINSRWIEPFSKLGFDILTYKTCRTREFSPHTFPHIKFLPELTEPVAVGSMPHRVNGSAVLPQCDAVRISVANSFRMPSAAPQVWKADIESLLQKIQGGQILIASVVGTAEEDAVDEREFVEDFLLCARQAAEVNPHAIELNFSCPNVYAKLERSVYQTPELASRIVERVRTELRNVKILVKIGYLRPEKLCELFKAIYRHIDGIVAINTMAVEVSSETGESIFPGNKRKRPGVSGPAIRLHAIETVSELRKLANNYKKELVILGAGGVSSAENVTQMLGAGADGVEICTAAIFNPFVAVEIRRQLSRENIAGNRSRYLEKAGLNACFSDREIGVAFDNMLQACEETGCPVDKALAVLQKEWLGPYIKAVGQVNSGDEFAVKTRRQAPGKKQIIEWISSAHIKK